MPLYQAILLGIIQGLTEFLPISSTAHLTIIPRLLHWQDPGLGFDIALHVGTLAAILIFFFQDWVQVISHGLGFAYRGTRPDENSRKLLWFLIVGTIPAALAGAKLNKYAEGPWRNFVVIGIAMVVIGIVMWIADRFGQEKSHLDSMTWPDALTIGVLQAAALVPGVSRSGITISAARFRDFNREAAARFSFLLSAPVIAGAAAKDALDLQKNGGLPPEMRVPYLTGIVVSAIVGILVIAFFLRFLRHNSLSWFVWYRVIFGIIIIALAVFFRVGG
ncbi:MAG: undecaprenyl-diphosphatase UppP [Acidobacteriaceae bacterium]|nr:undecaprenyl-diphosphatase UppP [Acidobacteriaceae bacterium]